jgi:hypothetical protein
MYKLPPETGEKVGRCLYSGFFVVQINARYADVVLGPRLGNLNEMFDDHRSSVDINGWDSRE